MRNKRRTDEYDHPSEEGGLSIFRIIQPPTFEGLCCLDHKKASLILSTERVVVETLLRISCQSTREREDANTLA
jgi:hypothetical protein